MILYSLIDKIYFVNKYFFISVSNTLMTKVGDYVVVKDLGSYGTSKRQLVLHSKG